MVETATIISIENKVFKTPAIIKIIPNVGVVSMMEAPQKIIAMERDKIIIEMIDGPIPSKSLSKPFFNFIAKLSCLGFSVFPSFT